MGCCGERKNITEEYKEIINKAAKSMCKITYQIDGVSGTASRDAFFINIINNGNDFRFLVACFDFSPKELENQKIELEINKKEKISLFIDYNHILEDPFYISVIQIKDKDKNIINNFEFLTCDENYIHGYNQYEDKDVFTLKYQEGVGFAYKIGKIMKIDEKDEFTHNIQTGLDSAGSPIILLSDSKIIGIQKNGTRTEKFYKGIFLGKILDELKKIVGIKSVSKKIDDEKKSSKRESDLMTRAKTETNIEENNNYILAEITIEKSDINEKKSIINSYQAYCRAANKNNEKTELKNEEEIRNCCVTKINGKEIPFVYKHKFDKIGTYEILYLFRVNLTNINHMYSNCYLSKIIKFNLRLELVSNAQKMFFKSHLISLNLSNINAKNLTDMSGMFEDCLFLEKLDLSKFNADKVTDMSNMFKNCKSLKDLNLSDFHTENVTDMSEMFSDCEKLLNIKFSNNFNTKNVSKLRSMFSNCKSLENIDLSEFNTENATDMSEMFSGCSSLLSIKLSNNFNAINATKLRSMFKNCKSLKDLNLPDFHTENVTDMSEMFYSCEKLSRLDLSNFNTKEVTNMSKMFYNCSSLSHLRLSKFTAKKHTKMEDMFVGCKDLEIEDLITKDKMIKEKFRRDKANDKKYERK